MCGIAGIFQNCVGLNPAIGIKVNQMRDSLSHRGPDDHGLFIDDDIVMAHARLSIIDTDRRGKQPMTRHSLTIVFNGEIYDYKELRDELILEGYDFYTKTDTEVIIAAYHKWGTKCLEKLNGMFAFAIWDDKKKELFCARDRLGIKPFYYTYMHGQFTFASEIKALLKGSNVKRRCNNSVVSKYLYAGSYGLPHETFYENVWQLPGGHSMMVTPHGIEKLNRYWQPEMRKLIWTERGAIDQYYELLLDAVKIHLRSDVPIGMALSSGLDSNLLYALIKKHMNVEALTTFTHTTSDPKYDETRLIDYISAIDNFNYSFYGEQDFTEKHARESQRLHGEPFGGLPTMIYENMFKLVSEQGIKVMLCGEGMDEQFAGYSYYDSEGTSLVQGTISPVAGDVLDINIINAAQPESYETVSLDRLSNLQYRDIVYTKIPRSLRFSDRISMAHGVELRVPFLDYRLIELSCTFPKTFLIRDGESKYLLRSLAKEKGLLTDKTINRHKRPMWAPQIEWMQRSIWINDIIESKVFSERGLYDMKKLKAKYKEFCNGSPDTSFYVWQWINLELWFQECMGG